VLIQAVAAIVAFTSGVAGGAPVWRSQAAEGVAAQAAEPPTGVKSENPTPEPANKTKKKSA
jgi:hypothetical protein